MLKLFVNGKEVEVFRGMSVHLLNAQKNTKKPPFDLQIKAALISLLNIRKRNEHKELYSWRLKSTRH